MENTKKRILVAIDGSRYSDKVIDTTIEYAKRQEAEVIFVHCHKKFPKLLGQPYRDRVISSIRDEAATVVKPYLDKLTEASIHYVERLMEGPAGAMITDIAENEQCDLIILGSRGLSNIQGLIIGSVTHRVLHTAQCPVLVVK